jgi:hypothetical protein
VFRDEIDSYPIDDYVRGTKLLFKPEKSHVDLAGPVSVSEDGSEVSFRFSEELAFNLQVPFLPSPVLSLSGSVSLHRSEGDGLIDYSRETWDKPVVEVLKTVHF